MIKHFELNTKGRDFHVGDLHGCYQEFHDHLLEVDFDFEKDRVFSVGDLIDRGDENLECLRLLKLDWFHAVRGNHEDMMLHGNTNIWYANGGGWAESLSREEMIYWRNEIRDMPLQITVDTPYGKFGVCHAEWPQPEQDPDLYDWPEWDSREEAILLWSRKKIRSGNTDSISDLARVVVGHTPLKHPVVLGNTVYIDTGAVFGDGYLTMMTNESIYNWKRSV